MHSPSLSGSSEPPLSPVATVRPTLVETPDQKDESWVEGQDLPEVLDPAEEEGERRVVVRLIGGDEVEVGVEPDRTAALQRAQKLVRTLAAAESEGEWPRLEGRFLRPSAIVSVDVLKALKAEASA